MLILIAFECSPLSSGYQGLEEEELIVHGHGLGAGAMLLYYMIIVWTTPRILFNRPRLVAPFYDGYNYV